MEKKFVGYELCPKCNVVINDFKHNGEYEMNNKHFVSLLFRCKCGNFFNEHITKEEYNKYITKNYY